MLLVYSLGALLVLSQFSFKAAMPPSENENEDGNRFW